MTEYMSGKKAKLLRKTAAVVGIFYDSLKAAYRNMSKTEKRRFSNQCYEKLSRAEK
jgi:hypothetical protein